MFPLPRLSAEASAKAGEGQGGGSLRNGGGNCFDDAAAVYHHVVIAEAKHLEAFRFDHSRALRIGPLAVIGEMLTSVEFDYEFCRMADEIGNIALDRHLASKAGALQTMIAQFRPENSFSIS